MLILSDQTCFLLQVLASSFISSHSILIETNSSRLLFELDETLEIKTSTLFNLVFGSNATLSCSFFFLLIIDLNVLILAVILEIFIVAAEFAVSTGLRTKEAKADLETHPVTTQDSISKYSI